MDGYASFCSRVRVLYCSGRSLTHGTHTRAHTRARATCSSDPGTYGIQSFLLFLRNTNGTSFQPLRSINLTSASKPYAALVGHLNADLLPDVVVFFQNVSISPYRDEVLACRNAGNFSFPEQGHSLVASRLSSLAAPNYQAMPAVLVADLFGDGFADIVFFSLVATSPHAQWGFFLIRNDADTFGAPVLLVNSSSSIVDAVVALDLVGSPAELELVGCSTAGIFVVQPAFLNATFITEQESVSGVAGLDADLDGDNDVLYCSSVDGRVGWYENLGDGRFASEPRLVTSSAALVSYVTTADFNHDGAVDILLVKSDEVAWIRSNGAGAFPWPLQTIAFAPDCGFSLCSYGAVQAVDVNGDSLVDVLPTGISVALPGSSYGMAPPVPLVWFANTDWPDYVLTSRLPIGSSIQAVAAGLLDADTLDDVVLVVSFGVGSPAQLSWSPNQGGSALLGANRRIIGTVGSSVESLALADFDGNGGE